MDSCVLQKALDALAFDARRLTTACKAGKVALAKSILRTLSSSFSRLSLLLGGVVQTPTKARRMVTRAKRKLAGTLPKPIDLGGFDKRVSQPAREVAAEPQLEASGCRALLLEVVRRAAYDWVLYRGSSKLPARLLAESAYQWLFVEEPNSAAWLLREKNKKGLTSFLTICHQLDIDPAVMRNVIRRMTERDIMGVGRPAERRKNKGMDEMGQGEDLPVFDVNVDSLPVHDYMFIPDSR